MYLGCFNIWIQRVWAGLQSVLMRIRQLSDLPEIHLSVFLCPRGNGVNVAIRAISLLVLTSAEYAHFWGFQFKGFTVTTYYKKRKCVISLTSFDSYKKSILANIGGGIASKSCISTSLLMLTWGQIFFSHSGIQQSLAGVICACCGTARSGSFSYWSVRSAFSLNKFKRGQIPMFFHLAWSSCYKYAGMR